MIKTNAYFVLIAVLAAIMLCLMSCHGKPEQQALSPHEIAEIIAETMRHAVISNDSSGTDSTSMLQVILNREQISEARFQQSLAHYRGDNLVWLQILEESTEILDSKKSPKAAPAEPDSTVDKE